MNNQKSRQKSTVAGNPVGAALDVNGRLQPIQKLFEQRGDDLNDHTSPAAARLLAEHHNGVSIMSLDLPSIEREMLLKQIENEINAGFLFVEAARSAYRRDHSLDGAGALRKALAAHEQALQHASESELSQVRAIIHQLADLHAAIDWLWEVHLKPQTAIQK